MTVSGAALGAMETRYRFEPSNGRNLALSCAAVENSADALNNSANHTEGEMASPYASSQIGNMLNL